jgi:sugar/nucleoside kinase (ribokinase family)
VLDLLAIGDLMLDVRVESEALAPGGDVPGRVRVRPAGTSANAAVWAASVGARAAVCARVGDDLVGRLLVAALEEAGVEPIVTADPRVETGSMLVVQADGERSMVADRGANGRLAVEDLPATIEARSVLLSGYVVLDPATEPVARAAIARARDRAQHVAVDAASWSLLAPRVDAFLEATRGCDVLLANAEEAHALTGLEPEDAADELGRRYRTVVVKMGERGAVMCWEGLIAHFGGREVRAVNPTGAGDAFDGVFLAALVGNRSPADALHAACVAGARVAAGPEAWPVRP